MKAVYTEELSRVQLGDKYLHIEQRHDAPKEDFWLEWRSG